MLQTGEEADLREQIVALKKRLANSRTADITRWENEQRLRLNARGKNLQLQKVDLIKISTPNTGSGFDIDPPNLVRIASRSYLIAYDVSMRLPKSENLITGLRVVFHPDPKTGARGFGTLPAPGETPKPRKKKKDPKKAPKAVAQATAPPADPAAPAPKPTFVLTAFSASSESVPGDQVNLNRLIPIANVTASSWLETYRPENVLDTRNENGWSPDPALDGDVHLTITFATPIDPAKTPYLTTQLNFGYGNNLIASHFEILATTGTDDGSPLPEDILTIVQMPPIERSPDQVKALGEYFATHADTTKRDRIALANLEERLAVLTQKFSTMVMDIAPQPRETFILNRGDYSQPTDKVTPGTPAVLPPLPAGAPANRLGLAQWITMREHPLTARVEVNRLWQIFFGTGLVATPADFGAQGQYPSHPDLLDWLAVDFRDHNWDVKRMIKKIVTSATYRQDSSAPGSAGRVAPRPRPAKPPPRPRPALPPARRIHPRQSP